MSVIIFQPGNVFTSDQSHYAKIAPIRICFGYSWEKSKNSLVSSN
jgi:hypothetical protein